MTHSGKSIKVAFLALPDKIHGLTMEADDNYIVGINNRDASITQRHALGHELAHIFRDHFTSGIQIQEAEREANREAWNYYRAYREAQNRI